MFADMTDIDADMYMYCTAFVRTNSISPYKKIISKRFYPQNASNDPTKVFGRLKVSSTSIGLCK